MNQNQRSEIQSLSGLLDDAVADARRIKRNSDAPTEVERYARRVISKLEDVQAKLKSLLSQPIG